MLMLYLLESFISIEDLYPNELCCFIDSMTKIP